MRAAVVAALVALAGCGSAAPKPPSLPPGDAASAQAAFAALVALTDGGTWQADLGGRTSAATFTLASNGHSVVQSSGYLAVFRVEDGRVIATLFPDDDYTARLASTAITGGTIDFTLIDAPRRGPGMPATARLVHEARGPDEVIQHWTLGGTTFDVVLRRSR
jgi:hypothetical protein